MTKEFYFGTTRHHRNCITCITAGDAEQLRTDIGNLDAFQQDTKSGEVIAAFLESAVREKLIAKGYREMSRDEYFAALAA